MNLNEVRHKQEDLNFVQNFLESRNLLIPKKKEKNIGINEARNNIIKMVKLNLELKEIEEKLKNNFKVFGEIEWSNYLTQVKLIKDNIKQLKTLFDKSTSNYKQLKSKIIQRHNKRIRLKKINLKNIVRKQQILENRLKIDKKINEWQFNKNAELTGNEFKFQEHRKLYLRLGEVTKLKIEAQKFVEMLINLQDLRKIRNNMVGNYIDEIEETNFQQETNNLITLWKENLENNTQLENELKIKFGNKNTNEYKWNTVLFGEPSNNQYNPLLDGEKNLRKFIEIRTSWDNFLTHENDIFGSSIPLGWITPNTNPIAEWKKFRF